MLTVRKTENEALPSKVLRLCNMLHYSCILNLERRGVIHASTRGPSQLNVNTGFTCRQGNHNAMLNQDHWRPEAAWQEEHRNIPMLIQEL